MSTSRKRAGRLILLAALLAPAYVVKLWDPDPWWHLATGRWIAAHGALPQVDPFSFTMAGAPWRAVDWLADLALYGAWRLGGDAGIGVLTAACAFSMLLVLGLLLRELSVEETPAAGVIVCVAVMVQGRCSMARPLMFGALLLCATLLVLGRTWRRQDRSAVIAGPLILLWSAVHPTALAGLAVLVVFAASAWLAGHARRRLYSATLLATGVAMVLIPSARSLFALALAHDRAPLALALTLEWRRSRFGDRELWLPALALLLGCVAARGRWRAALPFVGCALLGAILVSRYARNLTEAILLATPLGALAAQRAVDWLRATGRRSAPLLVTAVVGVALPLAHVRLAPEAFNASFGVGPEEGAVPVETLALLRTLPSGRLMNDCTLGGWLIWQDFPVYCDGRAVALYREAEVRALFLPLYQGAEAVEAACDRWDIHYLLARGDSDFERALMRSPAFVPLAYDRGHSLFVRRRHLASLPESVTPLEELRFVNDPVWLDQWYGAIEGDPTREARLEREVARALSLGPSRTLGATVVYLRQAKPALAERLEQAARR